MSVNERIARHYTRGDLSGAILDALGRAGKDAEALSSEDVAAVDEFHIGGRAATVAFAETFVPRPGMRLLDIGSGIGGASRYFAEAHGCHVTGIDLTPEYCDVARMLADRTRLADHVEYHEGDATSLPFVDDAFEGAYTMHVAMNIPDKAKLYREVHRVVAGGGPFGVYDVLKGPGGEVIYPVPWAVEPHTSFLVTIEELSDLLESAGFEVLRQEDRTSHAIAFFDAMQARLAETGPPPVGLHILMGESTQEKVANMRRNLDEGRIAPWMVICRKR